LDGFAVSLELVSTLALPIAEGGTVSSSLVNDGGGTALLAAPVDADVLGGTQMPPLALGYRGVFGHRTPLS